MGEKKGLALDLRSKGLVFCKFFFNSMGGIQLSAMHERSHFSSVFCLPELTILEKIKDKRRTKRILKKKKNIQQTRTLFQGRLDLA